ncbi:MAG: DUF4197 domain-containing protein [Desulfatitalea sp.]
MSRPFMFVRFAYFLSLSIGLCACQGGLGGVMDQVAQQVQADRPLGQNEIIAGLKQALEVGTGNAVAVTAKTDGYFKNPQIKIPLPEKVRKAEDLLRTVGFGEQVEAFEKSMNRAAERAAPEAKALFIGAIKQMTFADAKQILQGRENEATLYFKEKTSRPLNERFKPLVHGAMSEVGVTRNYQTIESKLRMLPLGGSVNLDLDQYVTDKALEGLFFMLAQEEAKIRKDPAARVTDLLKRVFGA